GEVLLIRPAARLFGRGRHTGPRVKGGGPVDFVCRPSLIPTAAYSRPSCPALSSLEPGIHVLKTQPSQRRGWPGQAWTSPAMTNGCVLFGGARRLGALGGGSKQLDERALDRGL